MSKIQLIAGHVHLSGDRNNTAYRGKDSPMTFPETLVLQAIHGGSQHVHSMVDIGAIERGADEEHARLRQLYGKVVDDLFPRIAGRASIPTGDENIPTEDEVAAGDDAADKARSNARKTRKNKSGKTSGPAENTGRTETEEEPAPAKDDKLDLRKLDGAK